MNRVKFIQLGLLVGVLYGVTNVPDAQAQQREERVRLNVVVSDRSGHYVQGLQAIDFRISEDGIVQKIDHFAEKEESYEITYLPAPNPNQGFRRINVQIVSDIGNLRVRHKPGYRPSQS